MNTLKRICNWKDYNKALTKRGGIIFSFEENHLEALYYQGKQERGGVRKFSKQMYEYLLTIKVLFRLPWRATIGFAIGLLKMAHGKEILLPHYSHAAREVNRLDLNIKSYTKKQIEKGLEVAFDSTGVNVYTTSGYHQRKHGKENLYRKRDQWKKLHIAMELNEQQILGMVFTESNRNDCEVAPELAKSLKGKIKKLILDGAYDTENVYKIATDMNAQAVIPPAVDSKAQDELKRKKPFKAHLHQRDKIIKRIREEKDFATGLKKWKEESGYHKRSLIESCMFRFKRIFGFHLQQKNETGRKNEVIAKINLLNKMAWLGRPQYAV